MSSVLIRGMKMPDACPNCPFVMAYYCLLIGISDDNEVTNYINKRHPNCPLVELPPHGRLIDADELKSKFRHGNGDDDADSAWISTIRRFITQADTIIEAEGSEE